VQAHDNLAPGSLSLGNTKLLDTYVNRSPYACFALLLVTDSQSIPDAIPASERAQCEYNQNKEFTLLKFLDASGIPRGFLSFLPCMEPFTK